MPRGALPGLIVRGAYLWRYRGFRDRVFERLRGVREAFAARAGQSAGNLELPSMSAPMNIAPLGERDFYSRKRARAAAVPHVEATDGGMGSVTQMAWSRSRRGRKYRKTLGHAWKRLLLNSKTLVTRWSAITQFDTGFGTLWLTNKTYAPPLTYFPVYAFNLSDIGRSYDENIGGMGVPTVGAVGYRLNVDDPNAVRPTYSWVKISQARGGLTGTSTSYQADVEETNTSLGRENHWQHLWSNCEFVFHGAKNRPTKIHMYVVTFPNKAGPLRELSNDGGTTWTVVNDTRSVTEIQDAAAWWQHYLARKVDNPIRSIKYSGAKQMNVLHHESFVIGNDVSINNDTNPLSLVKKFFYRNGRYYRSDIDNLVHQHPNVGYDPATGGALLGYDNVPISYASGPLAADNATQWLMIVAESYDFLKQADSEVNTNHASFDIVLRNKYAMVN